MKGDCSRSRTGNLDLELTTSPSWVFVIDRASPRALQQASKPSKSYFPNDEISIAFNEDVDCSLIVTLIFVNDEKKSSFPMDKLLVICQNNKVIVDFRSVVAVCTESACCTVLALHFPRLL